MDGPDHLAKDIESKSPTRTKTYGRQRREGWRVQLSGARMEADMVQDGSRSSRRGLGTIRLRIVKIREVVCSVCLDRRPADGQW